MLDTLDIKEVYALHSAPGTPVGQFYTTPGPIMASVDTFHVDIDGVGGHGAYPHETRDPIAAAVSIAQAIGTIVSRNHYALQDLVVSVTMIHSGTADNIIPDTAYLGGTVRTFDGAVKAMVKRRMSEIVQGQTASFGVTAKLRYDEGYPATVNSSDETKFAVDVARDVAAEGAVNAESQRAMGAEDFAYFLQKKTGLYLFIGNGDSADLHNPPYEFNDEVIPTGCSWFAAMAEQRMPPGKRGG